MDSISGVTAPIMQPIINVPKNLKEAATGKIKPLSNQDLNNIEEQVPALYHLLGELSIDLTELKVDDFDSVIDKLISKIDDKSLLPSEHKRLTVVLPKLNDDELMNKIAEFTKSLETNYQDNEEKLGKTRIFFALDYDEFDSLKTNTIVQENFPELSQYYSANNDFHDSELPKFLLSRIDSSYKPEYTDNYYDTEPLVEKSIPMEFLRNFPNEYYFTFEYIDGLIRLYEEGISNDDIHNLSSFKEALQAIDIEGGIYLPENTLISLYQSGATVQDIEKLTEKLDVYKLAYLFQKVRDGLDFDAVKKFGAEIITLESLGKSTDEINRFSRSLHPRFNENIPASIIFSNIGIDKANNLAAEAHSFYSCESLMDLLVFEIPVDKANQYAEKYQNRFNDKELRYLLRSDLSEGLIDEADPNLSGREIVLKSTGIIGEETLDINSRIEELPLDSIHRAIKSGFGEDDLQRLITEYKLSGIYKADKDNPKLMDKDMRLCLISGVSADFYSENQADSSPRIILDKYNRSKLADKVNLLEESLGIQEFNKVPLKAYQRMYDLLQGAETDKPIAAYCTTNKKDSDSTLFFSSWSEALSLLDNYDTFIVEYESGQEILNAMQNIQSSVDDIDGLVFSYHGLDNKMLIGDETNISTEDTELMKSMNDCLKPGAKSMMSSCQTFELGKVFFDNVSNIDEMNVPKRPYTYGCIVALPQSILFESQEHLLTLDR